MENFDLYENFNMEIDAETPSIAFQTILKANNLSKFTIGSCIKHYEKATKANLDKANNVVDMVGFGCFNCLNYIDVGITGYEIVTVKKTTCKCTAKFKVCYLIVDPLTNQVIESKSFKQSAEETALRLSLKLKKNLRVIKETKHTGNNLASELTFSSKFTKTKPRIVEKNNKKVIEIHKYIFFGKKIKDCRKTIGGN